jgi:WD40 repeat protein
MPDLKATKSDKTYAVDDGAKRGPLTMARLRLHPTARLLLGQCADRRLAVWDLDAAPQKGKKGEAVSGTLVCPHEAGWIRGFDIHPRGEWLATGGSDRRLKLWKCQDGKPAATPTHDVLAHEGWVEAVAFSPDGARIATVGADRQLKLWDAEKLTPIQSAPAHTRFPRDAAFTPDGKGLVTGGEDGVAIVWDPVKLEVVRRIDTGITSDQQGQTPALGGIIRLSVSHDSRWLAIAGDKQTLIFELATGHGVASIAQAGSDVLFGRRQDLLAAGEDTLRLWHYDPARFSPKPLQAKTDPKGKPLPPTLPGFTGKELTQIKRGGFSVGVAFAADDGLLAAGKTDGTVEVWTLS